MYPVNMRELRIYAGYNRKQCSALAAISEPTLDKIEKGEESVRPELVQRVLDVINEKLLRDRKIENRVMIAQVDNLKLIA